MYFQFYRFLEIVQYLSEIGNRATFVSVQYRKILHTCITLIYMAIYFSHTINIYIVDLSDVREELFSSKLPHIVKIPHIERKQCYKILSLVLIFWTLL